MTTTHLTDDVAVIHSDSAPATRPMVGRSPELGGRVRVARRRMWRLILSSADEYPPMMVPLAHRG